MVPTLQHCHPQYSCHKLHRLYQELAPFLWKFSSGRRKNLRLKSMNFRVKGTLICLNQTYLGSRFVGISGVNKYLPKVVSQITNTIKEIYGIGGRTFMVLNLAPIGCYPMFLVELPHESSDIDQFGCLISYNNAVVDYNTMLKKALRKTQRELSNANVVYVDTHAVLLELFQHPTSHGLKYGNKACCGHGGGAYNFNQQVFCGSSKQINGQTLTATACEDPYNYVSWDTIHATEAANKLTAYAILNGSYFDPPFSLQNFRDIQPIN